MQLADRLPPQAGMQLAERLAQQAEVWVAGLLPEMTWVGMHRE
jgi:hypothetical protein